MQRMGHKQHDWTCGGFQGLANCDCCSARNVTWRFKFLHRETRQAIFVCRICRDNFWPIPNTPKISDEQPQIMDHWETNRSTGQWPEGLKI